MNRIYLKISNEVIKSDKKSRYYLSYLQIRATSRQRSGGFTVEQLAETIKTSERTAKKHIAEMLKFGYIIKQKTNHYRIVRQKSLFNESKRNVCYTISNEELLSFTWRNIAAFRAMLIELQVQQNRNTRKALRKGIKIVNKRGIKENIKNRTKSEYDNLVASTYVSKITDKHFSTILKYRKKQSLAVYSTIIIKNESKAYYEPSLNSKGNKKNKSLGKDFIFKGDLLFVPVSTRSCYSVFFKRC